MKKTILSAFLSGTLLASLITVAGMSSEALAKPMKFIVKPNQNANLVSFNSDAPIEVINGKTNDITGTIKLDDSFNFDSDHPFDISFSVNLNSVDTGISLRNEHMRDNFLETKKYPYATYKATSIELKDKKPDLSKAQTVRLISKGILNVHGVKKERSIPLTVHYQPATDARKASVQVTGLFPIELEAHNINRPEALFVKLAEKVNVTVNTTGMQME
ncbi:MAG: YceI family protein [Cyanobacteria bacterium P01_H01_bin.74]